MLATVIPYCTAAHSVDIRASGSTALNIQVLRSTPEGGQGRVQRCETEREKVCGGGARKTHSEALA